MAERNNINHSDMNKQDDGKETNSSQDKEEDLTMTFQPCESSSLESINIEEETTPEAIGDECQRPPKNAGGCNICNGKVMTG